jgi:hypothetical protein
LHDAPNSAFSDQRLGWYEHPIGATGAILMTSLLHSMKRGRPKRGVDRFAAP